MHRWTRTAHVEGRFIVLTVLKRQRWWITRIAVLPVHLFLFAIAVFFLVRLIPGDPVLQLLQGQPVSPQRLAEARQSLGLSGSVLDQLRTYLQHVVTLKFGNSMITSQPVLGQIGQRLPQTVEITVIAMVGAVVVTLLSSLIVVLRPRNLVSRNLILWSRAPGAVPDFVLGVAGIFLFYSVLRWAPAPLGLYNPLLSAPHVITSFPIVDAVLSGNWTLVHSMISYLILPELVLIVSYSPFLMKLFIRGLNDAIDAAPTRFRIASGAPHRAVLLSVARRAAPATIAMFGTMFGYMLGGVVVIEQLFSMPGMGQFGVNAVNTSDLVSIEAFLLVVGALSLFVFLIVDILNMVVDPRRRPGLAAADAV
jgi:ABC-type dipeptide/oligopeptide/nickel transport system permease component